MAYSKGSVNKVTLLGRLGKDPELKYLPNGTAVANFSIATDLCWKDKDGGEEKTQTEWHRLVAWRQLAEIAGKFLKKGSQVYIEGRLQTRSWDDKDGKKCYTTEVVVEDLKLLGSKNSNQDGSIPEPTEEFGGTGSAGTVNSNAPVAGNEDIIPTPSEDDSLLF